MSSNPRTRPVEILLVDDDPDDVQLAREGLQEDHVLHHLHAVRDGVEAMAFLRQEGAYTQARRPDLILLDLKMPKKNGLEVLAEIKADHKLRRIPVIVLTTSDDPDDIWKAYDLQASCYITKPSSVAEIDRVMRSLKDFCLTVVKLPPRD